MHRRVTLTALTLADDALQSEVSSLRRLARRDENRVGLGQPGPGSLHRFRCIVATESRRVWWGLSGLSRASPDGSHHELLIVTLTDLLRIGPRTCRCFGSGPCSGRLALSRPLMADDQWGAGTAERQGPGRRFAAEYVVPGGPDSRLSRSTASR